MDDENLDGVTLRLLDMPARNSLTSSSRALFFCERLEHWYNNSIPSYIEMKMSWI